MKHAAAIMLAVAFAVPAMAQQGPANTLLLHWHMLKGRAGRHHAGAGPGGEIALSRRLSLYGDARFTPIETRVGVTFGGPVSTARIGEKRVIAFTGIAFRF